MELSDVYLLKPAEVIELLGVSRSWLYDAANSGRIPCVRLGSADGPGGFRLRELEGGIERSRVPPAAEKRAGRRSPAPADQATPPRRASKPDAGGLTQLRL